MAMRWGAGVRAAALLAALALVAPWPARASGAYSYAEMTMDDWVRAKSFEVTVEAVHAQDGEGPVGVASPSSDGRATGDADLCVIATSFVESGRTRRQVREKACPVSMGGFRYDANTFEASLRGTVRTQLWTQLWRVVSGRWVVVSDKTRRASARVDVIWRWAQNPLFSILRPCGDLGLVNGMSGPANVRGTIRFKGADLAVKIPPSTPGYLLVGACADAA